MKGKRNDVIYMRIEDIGTQTNMVNYIGIDMPLENLVRLRFNENNQVASNNVNNSNNNQKFKFCSNCGTKLKYEDNFCTNCGTKV